MLLNLVCSTLTLFDLQQPKPHSFSDALRDTSSAKPFFLRDFPLQSSLTLPTSNTKVLVTGSAGFIGFHLTHALLKAGYEVVGLDSINDYYQVGLKYDRLEEAGIQTRAIGYNRINRSTKYSNYRFIKLKLEDESALLKLFAQENFDYVVHLAAQAGVRYSIENPMYYINSNIVGFTTILEACRHFQPKHLVFASSSSVYGLNRKVPFRVGDGADHPVSLYGATKKSNEVMAHAYSHLFDLPITGLRFFTVYGPWGRPDMAYFLFADAIINNKPIKIFNNGNLSRDFTYVDDIVAGLLKVIEKVPQPGVNWNPECPDPSRSAAAFRLYNIGNQQPVNLLKFIEAIERELGKTAQKEYLPMQPGDVATTYADVSELTQDFDYQPTTSLDEGIRRTVDWLKRYYQYDHPIPEPV